MTFYSIQDVREVAIRLHRANCRHNHADGCSWFYECLKGDTTDDSNNPDSHNWKGYAHDAFYKASEKLIEKCFQTGLSKEQIFVFLETLADPKIKNA